MINMINKINTSNKTKGYTHSRHTIELYIFILTHAGNNIIKIER